jgi:hypothetical protein
LDRARIGARRIAVPAFARKVPLPGNTYPWILKWGQLAGLRQQEVVELITRARAETAPADAVYRDRKGRWRTTGDIKDLYTRRALGLLATPLRSNEIV